MNEFNTIPLVIQLSSKENISQVNLIMQKTFNEYKKKNTSILIPLSISNQINYNNKKKNTKVEYNIELYAKNNLAIFKTMFEGLKEEALLTTLSSSFLSISNIKNFLQYSNINTIIDCNFEILTIIESEMYYLIDCLVSEVPKLLNNNAILITSIKPPLNFVTISEIINIKKIASIQMTIDKFSDEESTRFNFF